MCAVKTNNTIITNKLYIVKVVDLKGLLEREPKINNKMVTYNNLSSMGPMLHLNKAIKARFMGRFWMAERTKYIIHPEFIKEVYEPKK